MSCHTGARLSTDFRSIQREIFIVISHVINEQGTGYEYSKSIDLKNEASDLKEHPKISKLGKFESNKFKRKGMIYY